MIEKGVGQGEEAQALDKGAEIIRRFGGIRPMASKVNAAVTTVQGWKKRDTIPANRRSQVLEAARRLDIDLSDLVPGLVPSSRSDTSDDATSNVITESTQTTRGTEKESDIKETHTAEGLPPQKNYSNIKDSETNLEDNVLPEQETGADRQAREEVASSSAPAPGRVQAADTLGKKDNRGAASDREKETDLPDSLVRSHTNGDRTDNSGRAPARDGGESREYVTMSEMEKQLTALRRKSYRQSVVISLFVAGFVFALAAFLLWPQAENVKETALQNNRRLVSLENDLTEMDTRIGGKKPHGAFFGGVLPEDIDRKLKDLEEKTGAVQSQVGRIAHEARNIAGELTSADGTPLAERISRLERRLQKVMSADDLQRLFSRIEAYKTNLVAGGELDAAMTQLASLLNSASVETDKTSASTPENNNIMEALKTVRGQDSALGQALADVEDENLKAAAMLLVFTQIRSSLGRNRSSFEKDLQILMRLAGDDNPELKAALEGLAPKAKDGVLTPAGLSKELRSLSGDIVAASLTGEDVSLGEKAKARLGDVLSVEKDGQILTGTDAQKHVQLAQALIDEGRIDEAVEELQKLQGAGRETAEPIIDEAQTLLLAREIETMVKKDIISNLAGEINHIPSTSMNSRAMLQSLWQEIERVTSPKVTYDPASGTAILPRRQLPGFMSQN